MPLILPLTVPLIVPLAVPLNVPLLAQPLSCIGKRPRYTAPSPPNSEVSHRLQRHFIKGA